MRLSTKAGEPQKLEPLFGPELSSVQTIDEISMDESDLDKSYCDYLDMIAALAKRADNPSFTMAKHSPELNAVHNEVTKLANNGRIYLRLAYLKYLSALGFSVDDAKCLADNIEGPCRSNIFEKVQRAEWALDMATVIVRCL